MRGESQDADADEATMTPSYVKRARSFTDDDLKNTKYLWEAINDRGYTTPNGIVISVDNTYGKTHCAITPEFIFNNNVTKKKLSEKLIIGRRSEYDETYFIINAKDKEEAAIVLKKTLQK